MHGVQSAEHVDASDKYCGLFLAVKSCRRTAVSYPKEPLEPRKSHLKDAPRILIIVRWPALDEFFRKARIALLSAMANTYFKESALSNSRRPTAGSTCQWCEIQIHAGLFERLWLPHGYGGSGQQHSKILKITRAGRHGKIWTGASALHYELPCGLLPKIHNAGK